MTQFDLTDFAGQKRDLRTMEPVAGKTGHCFAVGERHQLRALHVGLARLCRAGSPKAVVPPQDHWKFFSLQSSPHRTTGFFFSVVGLDDNLDIFFAGKNLDLGVGSAGGFYAGQALPGSDAGQEYVASLSAWNSQQSMSDFLRHALVGFRNITQIIGRVFLRLPGSEPTTPKTSARSCRRSRMALLVRAARDAPGHSCCERRIGGSNPVATAGLGRAILLPRQD